MYNRQECEIIGVPGSIRMNDINVALSTELYLSTHIEIQHQLCAGEITE